MDLWYKLSFLWAWLVLVVQLIWNMENLSCFYWKFRILSSAKIYIIYISTIHAGFCNARNSSGSPSSCRGHIFSVSASGVLWLSNISLVYLIKVHVAMSLPFIKYFYILLTVREYYTFSDCSWVCSFTNDHVLNWFLASVSFSVEMI